MINVYAGERRLKKGKYRFKQSFPFDPESVNVGILASEDEEITKDLANAVMTYAAYCAVSSIRNAYAFHDDKIILLKKGNRRGEEDPYVVEIDELTGDEDERAATIDDFFEGLSTTHISLTPVEIIKENKKSNTRILLMLLLLLVLAGGYWLFLNVFDASQIQITQTQAPQPQYAPLNTREKARLKRWASIQALGIVMGEAKRTVGRVSTRRLSTLRISEPEELPQTQPIYDEQANSWHFSSPKEENLRRGGIRISVSREIQHFFMTDGVEVSDPDLQIYAKSRTSNMTGGVKELMVTSDKKITRSCLETTLYGVSDKALPFRRGGGDIEIRLNKVSPTAVLNNIQWLVENCPFVIGRMELTDGLFSMSALLKESKR